MGMKFTNNAASTLAADITSGSTTIAIQTADAGEFPSLGDGDWFIATIVDASGNREIVKCTARTGGVLTVVRGQEGTTPHAFVVGDSLSLRLTAAVIQQLFADLYDLRDDLGDLAYLDSVDTAQITDAAVTDAKLRLSAAVSIIGRSANTTGSPTDIAAATNGFVLQRLTDALIFGLITTLSIADAAITTAKIANEAVTNAKIADGAVQRDQILDGEVMPSKMRFSQIDDSLGEAASDNDPRLISAYELAHLIRYHTLPYRGSDRYETIYPIGHTVILGGVPNTCMNNDTIALYAGDGWGPTTAAHGAPLAGTWARRGIIGDIFDDNSAALVQRIY